MELIYNAILRNDFETVREHINQIEDINALIEGTTLLFRASMCGNVRIVQLLLDHGADIEKKDFYSCKPLSTAIFNHHNDIVQLLLKRDADLNQPKLMWPYLHIAVDSNNITSVNLLLDAGYNIHTIDDRGRTAKDIAIIKGYSEIAELIDSYEFPVKEPGDS